MMKNIKLYLLFAVALIIGGCEKPKISVGRTVIVYMVADNNLSSYARQNINAMEKAFSELYGAKLLLFYNDDAGVCRIYDIQYDGDDNVINSPIIQEYTYKTNPCLPETLSTVIADCRRYSNTETYSLIFWSHGTGWMPQGMTPAKVIEKENPSDRQQSAPQYTFGSVYSFADQLEVWEIAEALPDDLVFDYINFDACYMGCVELVYQLRHNARYIMVSPAEILATGYPYHEGLKCVLSGDVKGMAKCFYDHYNSMSGVWRSATTTVVDCSKLEELAVQMRILVEKGGEVQTYQQFGRNLGSRSNYTNLFWDLGEMADLTWGFELTDEFYAALNDAIYYKATTPMMFEGDYYGEIEVNTYSGLTMYKPLLSQPKTLDIYTNNYDWAQDTKFYLLAQ